ncbi:MAG: ATP-binding protein [Terriglobia bacterium]
MKRALPLSTRTLVFSFLCMCGVLTAGFLALHAAIETRIKEGLVENLQETQQRLAEAQAEDDRHSTKLLATLSDNAGLKAAIALMREQSTPALRAQAERTIEDELRHVGAGLGYDLLMVIDTRGRIIATAGAGAVRVPGSPPLLKDDPPGAELVRLGDVLYRLTEVPINLGPENLGILAVGKKFQLRAHSRFGYSVLLGPGGIEATTLPPALDGAVTAGLLGRCHGQSGGCEIHAGKQTLVVLRAAPVGTRSEYRLLFLASTGRAMRGFTRGLWQAFLITACGADLIALLLALFISRSVAKPLADLAADLEKCGATGDLPAAFHADTPTLEVNMLAQALNHASAARREFELELTNARDAAQAASKSKSEFLANVSHELRTPLNGILGLTGLALDTALTAEQREYLTMVADSGQGLLTVINDILDFSNIQTGKLELAETDFSLTSSVADAMRPFAIQAREKGLRLICELKQGVPPVVTGDPARLRQVLIHLVGNALKFTERGAVKLRAETENEGGNACVLHFCVEDTGIGIAAEKQSAIFEAFAQADGSSTRKYGGAGLGLAIAAGLVEAMRGRIWVESQPERGSTFHFTARFGVPGDEVGEKPARLALGAG